MLILLLAFSLSAAVTLLLVRSSKVHAHRSGDRDFNKPQGFHAVAVPRIGGLGIVLGVLGSAGGLWWTQGSAAGVFVLTLLACAAPAFLAGFTQDFTEALTPRGRLLATAFSARSSPHRRPDRSWRATS